MLNLFIYRLLVINKKGRKRPLDTPERKIERRERERKRMREGYK